MEIKLGYYLELRVDLDRRDTRYALNHRIMQNYSNSLNEMFVEGVSMAY